MNKFRLFNSVILLLVLGTQRLNAQCPITLTDLENSCKLTSTEFEAYILSKGYSLRRSLNKPVRRKEYSCDSSGNSSRNDGINCSTGSGKNLIITYTTSDKELYENTRDSLVLKGYIFQKQVEMNFIDSETTWYYYVKGMTQVVIYKYGLLYVEEIRILD